MNSLNASDIGFILGIMGIVSIIFTIYNYFRNPQIKQDKIDAILQEKMRFMGESTERRFEEINKSFNNLVLQTNNHIHTVDVKVDKLTDQINSMGIGVARLATIIEERIPKNNG